LLRNLKILYAGLLHSGLRRLRLQHCRGNVAFWLPDTASIIRLRILTIELRAPPRPPISLQQNARAFTASAPQTWREAAAAA